MKIKKRKIINLIIFIIIFTILILFGVAIVELIKEYNANKKHEEHIEQVKEQVQQYTGVEDFKSIEEVLIYLDSEFISQEDAEDENIDYIVKAKLKYNLDVEVKNYYTKLIEYSASASKYKNFCIIDEEKNINILVYCNENETISSYYINNEKFYFENLESKENIKQYKETEKIKVTNFCNLLTQLISNNWQTTGINLGTSESVYKKYDIYFGTIRNWVIKAKNNIDVSIDGRGKKATGRPKSKNLTLEDYKERYEILKKYQAFLQARRGKK